MQGVAVPANVTLPANVTIGSSCQGCVYVSTTGNDGNPGTQASPWATVQHAVDTVTPGQTIVVMDGTYVETPDITTSGEVGARIMLRAQNPGAAILDGGASANNILDIFDDVDYWDFDGLVLQNSTIGAVSIGDTDGPNTGLTFSRLHIKDIGLLCTDSAGGIVGFRGKDATTDVVIERSTFENIGRFSEGESGCTNGNNNWQNHDHGIYMNGASGIVIRNNIFKDLDNGWAIQLAANSVGFLIAHNTFYGPNPNRDGHIMFDNPSLSGHLIFNNLFIDPTASIARVLSDAVCGDHPDTEIRNNVSTEGIYVSKSNLEYAVACADFTLTGNVLSEAGDLVVDDAGGDFSLVAGSAAIDAGLVGYATNDFNGAARDGSPDAGAFEYVAVQAISDTDCATDFADVFPADSIFDDRLLADWGDKDDGCDPWPQNDREF